MHSSAQSALECIDTKEKCANNNNNNMLKPCRKPTDPTETIEKSYKYPTGTLQEPYRNPTVVVVVVVVVVFVVVGALRAPFSFCINAF